MTLTKSKNSVSACGDGQRPMESAKVASHWFYLTGWFTVPRNWRGRFSTASPVPGELNYSLWLGVWLSVKTLAWIYRTQGLIPSKTQNPKLTSSTVFTTDISVAWEFSQARRSLGFSKSSNSRGGEELEEGGPRVAGIMRRAQGAAGAAGTAAASPSTAPVEKGPKGPWLPGNPGLSSSCCLIRYLFALKENASLEQWLLGFSVVVVSVLSLLFRSFLFHTLETFTFWGASSTWSEMDDALMC